MKEAHDRAYQILSERREQMDLMASVLLERETVEGEACKALLDNRWNEYLAMSSPTKAARSATKRRTPLPKDTCRRWSKSLFRKTATQQAVASALR